MKEKVKEFLKKSNSPKSPTEIGLALGKSYNQATAAVSAMLKKWVEEELVYKTKVDGKVLYGWFR